MPEYRILQIDAFTRRPFGGNPAAVVPLRDGWPDDALLQRIAMENNMSETAFFRASDTDGIDFDLRWFTPAIEVDLCGHATLATAHALFHHLGFQRDRVTFATRSGTLTVDLGPDGRLDMDFPARTRTHVEITDDLVEALGRRPVEAFVGEEDRMCVFDNKRDVHELDPDLRAITAMGVRGMIVTAPGAGHDFVSRFFAPAAGVNEDPVTGSAHCMLAPYWSERLSKHAVVGHQVSKRGGEVWCEVSLDGTRVCLSGNAVTVLEGVMRLP